MKLWIISAVMMILLVFTVVAQEETETPLPPSDIVTAKGECPSGADVCNIPSDYSGDIKQFSGIITLKNGDKIDPKGVTSILFENGKIVDFTGDLYTPVEIGGAKVEGYNLRFDGNKFSMDSGKISDVPLEYVDGVTVENGIISGKTLDISGRPTRNLVSGAKVAGVYLSFGSDMVFSYNTKTGELIVDQPVKGEYSYPPSVAIPSTVSNMHVIAKDDVIVQILSGERYEHGEVKIENGVTSVKGGDFDSNFHFTDNTQWVSVCDGEKRNCNTNGPYIIESKDTSELHNFKSFVQITKFGDAPFFVRGSYAKVTGRESVEGNDVEIIDNHYMTKIGPDGSFLGTRDLLNVQDPTVKAALESKMGKTASVQVIALDANLARVNMGGEGVMVAYGDQNDITVSRCNGGVSGSATRWITGAAGAVTNCPLQAFGTSSPGAGPGKKVSVGGLTVIIDESSGKITGCTGGDACQKTAGEVVGGKLYTYDITGSDEIKTKYVPTAELVKGAPSTALTYTKTFDSEKGLLEYVAGTYAIATQSLTQDDIDSIQNKLKNQFTVKVNTYDVTEYIDENGVKTPKTVTKTQLVYVKTQFNSDTWPNTPIQITGVDKNLEKFDVVVNGNKGTYVPKSGEILYGFDASSKDDHYIPEDMNKFASPQMTSNSLSSPPPLGTGAIRTEIPPPAPAPPTKKDRDNVMEGWTNAQIRDATLYDSLVGK